MSGSSNSPEKIVRAGLLIIGDEILSGRTQDTNLRSIADFLRPLGVRLAEARVVADETDAIVMALNALRSAYDYVFTTGGIGPTHDDITIDAVAQAFGLEVAEHPEAVRILEAHYPTGEFTEARRRMTRAPIGARLIHNHATLAPGFEIGNVFILAGVPMVMRAMLESLPGRMVGSAPTVTREYRAPGARESAIAGPLAALAKQYRALSFGSYPFFSSEGYGVSIVIRGTDPALVAAVSPDVQAIFQGLGVVPNLVE